MRDLADTAQRLRIVKQATRDFLSRWALHDPIDGVEATEELSPAGTAVATADAELSDYKSHDWSLMYRGSVLDD